MIERCEERDEDKRVADNTIKKLREDISELIMWKKQAVDRCVAVWPSLGPHMPSLSRAQRRRLASSTPARL